MTTIQVKIIHGANPYNLTREGQVHLRNGDVGVVMEDTGDRYRVRWPNGDTLYHPYSILEEVGFEHLSPARMEIVRKLRKELRQAEASLRATRQRIEAEQKRVEQFNNEANALTGIIETIREAK